MHGSMRHEVSRKIVFAGNVGIGVATVSVQVRRQETRFRSQTPKRSTGQETIMNNFNTQPPAKLRAAVFAVSLLMTSLCLSGVALSFTWDAPEHVAVAQSTPPAHV
jgi:hypothetical protein